MENLLREKNIKSTLEDRIITSLRESISVNSEWVSPLLQAIGDWTIPAENVFGNQYQYLILGEALDWLAGYREQIQYSIYQNTRSHNRPISKTPAGSFLYETIRYQSSFHHATIDALNHYARDTYLLAKRRGMAYRMK